MRTELPDTATISLWPINRQNPLSHRRTQMSPWRARLGRRRARLGRRRARLSRRLPTLVQRRNRILFGEFSSLSRFS
jgi:hypothetical protein